MKEKHSDSHLHLVMTSDHIAVDDFSSALFPAPSQETQLSLFPEPRPHLIVILGIHLMRDNDFTEALHRVQPRVVVDVRFSPRFDLGLMTRKSTFALFRELRAVYLDLFSMVGRDADLESALRGERFQERFAMSTRASAGPIVFLADSMVPCAKLFHAVQKNVTESKGSHWDFVLYPPAL